MTDEKPETPRDRLFRMHEEVCKTARQLMRKKNEDYGRADDPLFNFRRHGLKGMIVRLDDKMCRMDNFVERGIFAVEDEGIDDWTWDVINYAILTRFWIQEEKAKKA
jgi:hypothetical protein